ncbi:hypothetical protein WMY93_031012 [Mugilogobius chulae]|uniref:Uncharacterized protein n=1 Tax=Mugilogobius chulae TaxID=88201 RepID=A0AAW0MH78_9GOBI
MGQLQRLYYTGLAYREITPKHTRYYIIPFFVAVTLCEKPFIHGGPRKKTNDRLYERGPRCAAVLDATSIHAVKRLILKGPYEQLRNSKQPLLAINNTQYGINFLYNYDSPVTTCEKRGALHLKMDSPKCTGISVQIMFSHPLLLFAFNETETLNPPRSRTIKNDTARPNGTRDNCCTRDADTHHYIPTIQNSNVQKASRTELVKCSASRQTQLGRTTGNHDEGLKLLARVAPRKAYIAMHQRRIGNVCRNVKNGEPLRGQHGSGK